MRIAYDIADALIEEENVRIRVEKALTGKKSLPVEVVIQQQKEKWKGAWASGQGRKMETL